MNEPWDVSRLADALPEEFREVSGSHLAAIFARKLEERSAQDQDDLDRELDAWIRRMQEHFIPQLGVLDEAMLRYIALAPGESTATEHAEDFVRHHSLNQGLPPEVAADFVRLVVADSRGARRARNLIKHRRKCVSAILAMLDVVDARTTRRIRDLSPQARQERDSISAMRIDSPAEFHEWAVRTFELFASAWREEWTSERPFPESLLNNYRTEWMDFVHSMPLEFKAHDSLIEAKLESAFERRFERSLHELRVDAANRSTLQMRSSRIMRSDLRRTPSDWPRAFSTAAASAWDSMAASPQPTETTKPRLELKIGPSSATMVIGSELLGARDVDQLAMRLSLELTDPGDPTEILVRAIAGTSPAIEVTVQTSDRSRITDAFTRAQLLLQRG